MAHIVLPDSVYNAGSIVMVNHINEIIIVIVVPQGRATTKMKMLSSQIDKVAPRIL
jgi:hypothetical protein